MAKITSTRQELPFVKMVLYGPGGIGKTYCSASAPDPVIISVERGTLCLAERDVPMAQVSSLAETYEVYNDIIRSGKYKTLVVDSISELSELVLQEQIPLAGRDLRQAYGAMGQEMLKFAKKLRDTNMHVVLIAKEETVKDEITGRVTYRPSAQGQMFTEQIPYIVDLVLAIKLKQEGDKQVRFLRTQPDTFYTAKDRSGKLLKEEPFIYGQPTLTNIFNKLISTEKK